MHVIGPDNRETIILTLPSYRTRMRQTRQDGIMHDAIVDHDPNALAWDNVESARANGKWRGIDSLP